MYFYPMKKISDEEFSKLHFRSKNKKERKPNKGKSSVFYSEIIGLHVGEITFISTEEWKGYRTPTRICRYIMKNFPKVKYFFEKLKDGSGWVIKRLE